MNANVINTHCFHNMKFFRSFTMKSCDLMTTLTYVLMDNLCPCFINIINHCKNDYFMNGYSNEHNYNKWGKQIQQQL